MNERQTMLIRFLRSKGEMVYIQNIAENVEGYDATDFFDDPTSTEICRCKTYMKLIKDINEINKDPFSDAVIFTDGHYNYKLATDLKEIEDVIEVIQKKMGALIGEMAGIVYKVKRNGQGDLLDGGFHEVTKA